jgi:hypothetical protein
MPSICRWRVPFVARALGGSHNVQICELELVGGVDVGVLRVVSRVQNLKVKGEADEESGV